MVPLFPAFKPLELKDKQLIEKYTQKFPPYSDYNFPTLYGYNTENIAAFSFLHDNLVMLLTDYITNEQFLSFIGSNNTLNTTLRLLHEANKKHILPYLKLIPEICITSELKDNQTISIEEDKDNFDYILSVRDIVNFSPKHYNKTKQYRQFEKNFPQKIVRELNLENISIQEQIITLLYNWQREKGKTDEDTITEIKCIKRTIEDARYLNVFGIGVYLDDILIGFSLADTTSTVQAEFHFVKAFKKYKGIYAALYIYIAQALEKKGYKYMNIEQDLGIEGLRKAKQQWHPCDYLKKYKISPVID